MSDRRGRDKRSSRRSPSPSDDDDSGNEGPTHIACWIPSASIDLVVLAAYLKEFIDASATIKPSPNPQDHSKQGYLIGARFTLSVAGCRDIIEDSRDWEEERSTRKYRKEPWGFYESDTWDERKKKGASPGNVNPRKRRQPTGAVADAAVSRTEPTRAQGRGQTADRHQTRPGPAPEPPRPPPRNPPPDVLKPDSIGTRLENLSMSDERRPSATDENANRGARVQSNTSSVRHGRESKHDDDVRSVTSSASTLVERRTEDRHASREDDGRSTTSGNKKKGYGRY